MKVRFIRRYAGVLACVAPALANAQTPADAQTIIPELNAITVTASRVPVDGRTQPVSISVISAADIAASSARTLQDLLSTQTGISVINTTCSSDNAIVDLRGFGMTGASNTLIMIDGVRQNDNDLSAPSLGVIPLSQVERVEIVRGSGSVQYGGGTTGGVINVISKKHHDEPVAASATFKAGNYGLRQTDASIALNNDHVSVNAFMQSLHTDNYRENNKERREGGGAGVGFRHDGGSLYFYGRSTSQRLGLPGPRRIDPFTGVNEFKDDPRGATYLSDYLKVRSEAFGMQFEQRLGAGTLFADINQRDKDLDGYSLSVYDEIRRKQDLDELTASVRYQLPIGEQHSLVFGLDSLNGETDSVQNGQWDNAQWRSRQRQHGFFTEGQFRATDSTFLTAGVRRQYVSSKLDVLAGSSNASDESQHLNAWQLGLRQELNTNFGLYAKLGRSFRLPNADELLSVQKPLQPQTSTDKELGITWKSERSSARLAWFRYDLKNELLYNPLADGVWGPGTGANVNMDPTRRQGIELEGRYALTKTLSVNANATWLQAKFRSGNYYGVDLRGNTVPLVPNWLANAGLTWKPDQTWLMSVSAQYVGRARLDNDQANQFGEKLDDYLLFNGKIAYAFSPNVEGALAINNIFDKQYASYGIRGNNAAFEPLGSIAAYNLYPLPGRNFYASLTLRY